MKNSAQRGSVVSIIIIIVALAIIGGAAYAYTIRKNNAGMRDGNSIGMENGSKSKKERAIEELQSVLDEVHGLISENPEVAELHLFGNDTNIPDAEALLAELKKQGRDLGIAQEQEYVAIVGSLRDGIQPFKGVMNVSKVLGIVPGKQTKVAYVVEPDMMRKVNATFYKDVQAKDVVIIFTELNKVALYRPSTQAIIAQGVADEVIKQN